MSMYTCNNGEIILETQFEISQCHLDWICIGLDNEGHKILGTGITEIESIDDWFNQRYK